MRRRYILFDLDGTLTDPGPGITRSVQYALRSYGIDEPDLTKLYPFIGPPLKDSFMKYYGFSEEKAMEAIWRYREYFTAKGIFENRVYEGIPQMLEMLKKDGRILLIATSKPEDFAVQIVRHFDLEKYFDLICGASMDEVRTRKGEIIGCALNAARIADGREAVMVGDREHDVLGARENGLDCIGVLFGYGSRKELEEVNAYRIVETAAELGAALMEDQGK